MDGPDLDRVVPEGDADPSPVGPIEEALSLIVRFGGIDGDDHKAWVLDQVARVLAREQYGELVERACGPDGEYEWSEGIAP